MERGKLIQERQNEVDELKKELGKKDAKMKNLIEDFNQKKDLVNSNLRVSFLYFLQTDVYHKNVK